MKSTDQQSGRSGKPNTMLGTAKPSHGISKVNAFPSGATSSTRIIPIIRTVQIPSPQIFKTDQDNFLALVQKLTGKKPAPKKLTGKVRSKKSDSIEFKKTVVRAQSAANHSHALSVVDGHSFSKQVSEKEYDVVAPLTAIERDSLEEDGVQVCDSFSEDFGGLEKWDFLTTLTDSWSTLPEFPMIYPSTPEQIDYHSTGFETLNSGGFSHFYQ